VIFYWVKHLFDLFLCYLEIWYDEAYTKAELMMLVRANKPKPIYRAT
jgi:hypothetical protein